MSDVLLAIEGLDAFYGDAQALHRLLAQVCETSQKIVPTCAGHRSSSDLLQRDTISGYRACLARAASSRTRVTVHQRR